MENNLVELNHNRVNKFFENMIIKYETDYKNNKTITEEICAINSF